MQRNFIYFAAFTGMSTASAATLLVAALMLGATDRAGATRTSAEPSAATADGPLGEITNGHLIVPVRRMGI